MRVRHAIKRRRRRRPAEPSPWRRSWKILHDEAVQLIHDAADDKTRKGRHLRTAYRAGCIQALLWATEQGWSRPRDVSDLNPDKTK